MLMISESEFYSDFNCPFCGKPLSATWSTEYGEPMDGTWKVKHLLCNQEFFVEVETTTRYTTRLREGG